MSDRSPSTTNPTQAPPTPAELGTHADGGPLSACRACGSTERSKYAETNRQEHDGRLIRWLRCTCLACGQVRVDRVESDAATAAKQGGRRGGAR